VLEDHPDLPASDLPKLLGRHVGDVLAIQVDVALGRHVETVDGPQDSRLSAPGEADDDENLARVHVEARVVGPDGRARLPLDLGLALARPAHLERLPGPASENHRAVLYPDDRVLALILVSLRGLSPLVACYTGLHGLAPIPPPDILRNACNPPLRPASICMISAFRSPFNCKDIANQGFQSASADIFACLASAWPFVFHSTDARARRYRRPPGRGERR
jgi:hypothetical protein